MSINRLMNMTGPDLVLEDLAHWLDRGQHGDVRIQLYPFGGLVPAAEWAAQ